MLVIIQFKISARLLRPAYIYLTFILKEMVYNGVKLVELVRDGGKDPLFFFFV
jgi:hypothetical protein